MKDLRGRTAVITGAASGMGRGTALALAARGVNLALADLNGPGLEAAAAAAEALGVRAIPFVCDVSDDAAFPALRSATLEAHGRIDIVMNNVGVIANGLPTDIPTQEWARILDINFLSIVRSNHAFLPDMLAQGFGHVVNTASFAALYPYAYDRLPYMTSKAAVIAITKGMALWLKPKGIGVTLLAPGTVESNIRATLKQWGDKPLPLRGLPKHFVRRTSDEVGQMVADAIERDIFFLPTDSQINAVLQDQAADQEAFINAQIELVNNDYPGVG